MTEQDKQAEEAKRRQQEAELQAKLENLRRQAREEHIRQQQAYAAQQAEFVRQQNELNILLQHRVQEAEDLMKDPISRHNLSIIVAVDQQGGFSKNKQIPWHYSEDMQWFKRRTDNHLCIMDQSTYNIINNQLGEKAKNSVLPNRQCYVVSFDTTSLPNAHVIKNLGEIDNLLDFDDKRTRFVIGGSDLFHEAISTADTVYTTIINKSFDCDEYFPVNYLLENFNVSQMFKKNEQPDLRFIVWERNHISQQEKISTEPIDVL